MKSNHEIRPKHDEKVTRTRKTIDDWRVKESKRNTLTRKEVSIEQDLAKCRKKEVTKKTK